MEKSILNLLLLALLNFCQITFAQSGIYLTSGSGWANQKGLPTANNAQANSVEQIHLPILRLGIGYLHDFNDTIGLGFEVGKGWYANSTYHFSNKEITIRSVTQEFLAVIVLHQKSFDYFVKAGGIRHTLKGFADMVGESNTSETKIQPQITAGIGYHFNKHFAITSEYIHSFGSCMENFSAENLQCPSISTFLVGIRIAFW